MQYFQIQHTQQNHSWTPVTLDHLTNQNRLQLQLDFNTNDCTLKKILIPSNSIQSNPTLFIKHFKTSRPKCCTERYIQYQITQLSSQNIQISIKSHKRCKHKTNQNKRNNYKIHLPTNLVCHKMY